MTRGADYDKLSCMRIVLLAMLAAAVVPASAQPLTNAIGLGFASCGDWTEGRRLRQSGSMEQWSLGFLSGVGAASQGRLNPLHGTDALAVIAWIDNYCSAHPLSQVMEGAEAFVRAHPR